MTIGLRPQLQDHLAGVDVALDARQALRGALLRHEAVELAQLLLRAKPLYDTRSAAAKRTRLIPSPVRRVVLIISTSGVADEPQSGAGKLVVGRSGHTSLAGGLDVRAAGKFSYTTESKTWRRTGRSGGRHGGPSTELCPHGCRRPH